jgi:hypothetical protein
MRLGIPKYGCIGGHVDVPGTAALCNTSMSFTDGFGPPDYLDDISTA